MWPSSKQPLPRPLICSLDLPKNRGTKLIWTKRRDALGFGLQPPCQRAKIADCPSVSPICLSTVRCISWGQSGRAKLVCGSLSTKLHIYQKAKTKSKAERSWIKILTMLWRENNHFNSSVKTMLNISFWHLTKDL